MQIQKTLGAPAASGAEHLSVSCCPSEYQLHDDITGAKIKLCDCIRKNDVSKVRDFFALRHAEALMAGLANGRTPLHEAAFSKSVEMTRLLLEYLPSEAVNARNANGNTALMLATKKECEPVVRALLKGNASCNVKDALGYTALIWAVSLGSVDIVKLCWIQAQSRALRWGA